MISSLLSLSYGKTNRILKPYAEEGAARVRCRSVGKRGGDVAALDDGRRTVECGAEAETVPEVTGALETLRRAGAVGREPSRRAGETRSASVSDEHGGRLRRGGSWRCSQNKEWSATMALT